MKIGDKIIAVENWYSFHPIIGVVVCPNLDVDPNLPILINIDETKKIEINDRNQYEKLGTEERRVIRFTSEKTSMPYSDKNWKYVNKFFRYINKDRKYSYINPEKAVYEYFAKQTNILKIELFIIWKNFVRISITVIDNIFLGVPELLFGDILGYFCQRNKNRWLKKEKLKIEKEKKVVEEIRVTFSRVERDKSMSCYEDKICKIDRQIEENNKDKIDASRSLLTFLVALAGLVIAIIGL